MGYIEVDEVLKHSPLFSTLDLTTIEWGVLVAVAHYASEGNDRECWPTGDQLGALTQASRASVLRALTRLEGLGFIARMRSGPSDRWRRIRLQKVSEWPVQGPQEAPTGISIGSHSETRGSHTETVGSHPETSTGSHSETGGSHTETVGSHSETRGSHTETVGSHPEPLTNNKPTTNRSPNRLRTLSTPSAPRPGGPAVAAKKITRTDVFLHITVKLPRAMIDNGWTQKGSPNAGAVKAAIKRQIEKGNFTPEELIAFAEIYAATPDLWKGSNTHPSLHALSDYVITQIRNKQDRDSLMLLDGERMAAFANANTWEEIDKVVGHRVGSNNEGLSDGRYETPTPEEVEKFLRGERKGFF